jgi:hypothetical protein
MILHAEAPPEIIFDTPLTLEFKYGVPPLKGMKANFYGNLAKVISIDEWTDLLLRRSQIDVVCPFRVIQVHC